MSELFDRLVTVRDVQSLIDDSARENEVLEYKTASKKFTDKERGEIPKDISGFANSLGGVIIYGVSTHPGDPSRPKAIEPIYSGNIESLDRVLNSTVRPPIAGIRKKLIPGDAPIVMILDVPASEDPPHQSLHDKKYYYRSGSECIPMDHDLVAQKFGRKLAPILQLRAQSLSTPEEISTDPTWYKEARLRLLLENGGRRVGRYVNIILMFPPPEFVRLTDVAMNLLDIDRLYPGAQARQFIDNHNVYHPGMNVSIVEIGCTFAKSFVRKADTVCVGWTLYAEDMNPRQGNASYGYLARISHTFN
jgi:hypothetical protein